MSSSSNFAQYHLELFHAVLWQCFPKHNQTFVLLYMLMLATASSYSILCCEIHYMQHIVGYQPEVSSQLRASFLLWLAFTLKLYMYWYINLWNHFFLSFSSAQNFTTCQTAGLRCALLETLSCNSNWSFFLTNIFDTNS